MENIMIKFESEINQIAAFARARNFNPATDDFDTFILEWVKSTVKFYSVNNQDSVYQMVKNILGITVK